MYSELRNWLTRVLIPISYAELLSDMYTQTQFAVSMPVLS